jgi:hypothetical protein
MTTRNFRVNNGLSVGDIVISASTNTITGLSTEAPSAEGDVITKGYLDTRISALSSTSITQGNSDVTVADSGTGSVTITVDGAATMTHAAAGITVGNALSMTVSNKSVTLSPTGSGTVTISPATTGSINNMAGTFTDVRVTGNLTVDGDTVTINTTTLSVEDAIIECNRNVSSNAVMPTYSGLKINRGEGSTATEGDLFFVWDESFNDGSTAAGGCFTAGRGANDSPDELVDIRCNVIRAVATSAQYADIAERFAADAVMTPGAVVMFGGSQEITETAEELSEKVFGVVSTQPAYMMNSGAGNNDSHPFVAMTGRTPVRVTGTVNKGDRLVSSSVKGTARAARTGESINPFHVIGRALESKSDAGIGLVNCFVQAKN